MDPKPDHGEVSYTCSGRLAGRKALPSLAVTPEWVARPRSRTHAKGRPSPSTTCPPKSQMPARWSSSFAFGTDSAGHTRDLRDEAFCRRLVGHEAVRRLGGIDILVSNAARQQTRASILDITTEDFDATMKTNIYAPFRHQGGVAASGAWVGGYRHGVGTGVRSVTRPLRLRADEGRNDELREVARKTTRPEGNQGQRRGAGADLDPLQVSGGATQEKLEKFGGQTPLGRPGQPVELASIYVQLAAEDASYATGRVHGSGGGRRAAIEVCHSIRPEPSTARDVARDEAERRQWQAGNNRASLPRVADR